MAFTLQKAIRRKISMLFGLAGASGSGKTKSALILARGMVGPQGKITVIDTEGDRALHYAPPPGEVADNVRTFDFDHIDFPPPFTPERYIEAVQVAVAGGAEAIIIDSMSHEWDGEGGCSDMQLAEAIRMATDKQTGILNEGRIEAMTAPAWKRPKVRHKRMMARLTQVRAHVFFCLRAQEKVKMEGAKVTPMGFMPICEKSFMFELTGSMTLHPETPGKARYDLPRKLNDDLQAIFPDRELITLDAGARLGRFAEIGIDRPPPDRATTAANLLIDRIASAPNLAALEVITAEDTVKQQRAWMKEKRPELNDRVDQAVADALGMFDQGDDGKGDA